MNKEQKLNAVRHAYTTYTKGDKDIQILDTEHVTDMATQNAILDIQHGLDEGISFDLKYNVMSDACNWIDENIEKVEDIKDVDNVKDIFDFQANVYTDVRLSWLTKSNQYDISELMKEYELDDISTACAVWYENRVEDAVIDLVSYILQ